MVTYSGRGFINGLALVKCLCASQVLHPRHLGKARAGMTCTQHNTLSLPLLSLLSCSLCYFKSEYAYMHTLYTHHADLLSVPYERTQHLLHSTAKLTVPQGVPPLYTRPGVCKQCYILQMVLSTTRKNLAGIRETSVTIHAHV